MSLSGPQHAKKAEDLLWKAENAKNGADRASHYAGAQVHATLALLAAVVHGGTIPEKKVNWWRQHGVKD